MLYDAVVKGRGLIVVLGWPNHIGQVCFEVTYQRYPFKKPFVLSILKKVIQITDQIRYYMYYSTSESPESP